MEITETMINAVRSFVRPPCSRERAQKVVQHILAEVEKLEGYGYEWHEATTMEELGQGRRVFLRGRKIGEEFEVPPRPMTKEEFAEMRAALKQVLGD